MGRVSWISYTWFTPAHHPRYLDPMKSTSIQIDVFRPSTPRFPSACLGPIQPSIHTSALLACLAGSASKNRILVIEQDYAPQCQLQHSCKDLSTQFSCPHSTCRASGSHVLTSGDTSKCNMLVDDQGYILKDQPDWPADPVSASLTLTTWPSGSSFYHPCTSQLPWSTPHIKSLKAVFH